MTSTARRLDRRLILVLLAGCGLAALCAWRVSVNQPARYNPERVEEEVWQAAPGFEALDADNQMFRLERYLGRHRVLVVFAGEDRETLRQILVLLASQQALLKQRDVKVVVLSPALPQVHRQLLSEGVPVDFPVLTDLQSQVQARWAGTAPPLTFLIDRKGDVLWQEAHPRSAGTLSEVLQQLLKD